MDTNELGLNQHLPGRPRPKTPTRSDMSSQDECVHCGEKVRPNQTGGWYHVETDSHKADQRCFLYATHSELMEILHQSDAIVPPLGQADEWTDDEAGGYIRGIVDAIEAGLEKRGLVIVGTGAIAPKPTISKAGYSPVDEAQLQQWRV